MATAELPEELITEILTRLPVKSIKRFRCLAKSLCELIDSPQFIDSHFSKSSQNFNLRKLIFQDLSRMEFQVCDGNLDLEEEVIRLENPVSSPWNSVYGYCKGLFLLDRGNLKLAVWNPSTRQYRDLPDLPLEDPSNVKGNVKIGLALWYDEAIDDYKALFIMLTMHDGGFVHLWNWIYVLKSNIWTRSKNLPLLLLKKLSRDRDRLPRIGFFTQIDGVLHWICTDYNLEYEIVAYDMRNETVSILPQPNFSLDSSSGEHVLAKLHVLEGCLCISYVSRSMPLQADLYIRKKDETDQFAWTQLFSVKEHLFGEKIWFENVSVLGYLKTGDKIMLDLGEDYLVSYDLKGKKFGKVEIDKDPDWKSPILCLESLVPV